MGDFQGHPFRGNQYTDARISNDVTGSYSGQVNGTLRAQDADGKTLAYLDWVQYGDSVSISMVETAPEARRQGLAKKLVERLLNENPGSKLEWGMTTPEGTALRAKMEATNPRLREQVDADRRAKEYAARSLEADRAEYAQLRDSFHPGMDPEAGNLANDRLSEIDKRWGGDIDHPTVETPEPAKIPDYPHARATVDGRKVVHGLVPNASSIASSLDKYRVLPGIRDVPMTAIPKTSPRDLFYAADDLAKVNSLADQIKDSKLIVPLIVVNDREGTYVLEGAHRLGALHVLRAKSFPALVVEDLDPEIGVEA